MKKFFLLNLILGVFLCASIQSFAKPVVIYVGIGERPRWWTGDGEGCVPGYYFCWGKPPQADGLSLGNWVDINIENKKIKVSLMLDNSNGKFIGSLLKNGNIVLDKDVVPVHRDIVKASCGKDVHLYIPKGSYRYEIVGNCVIFTADVLLK